MTAKDRKLNLTHVSIQGYRSIQSLDRLPLRDINILIGANGVGKSNFIEFVEFFSEIAIKMYKEFIEKDYEWNLSKKGIRFIDELIFFKGACPANTISACLESGLGRFRSVSHKGTFEGTEMEVTSDHFQFYSEAVKDSSGELIHDLRVKFDPSSEEAVSSTDRMLKSLAESTLYNFQSIRETIAGVTVSTDRPDARLAPDGANIDCFLRRIKKENGLRYEKILGIIQMVAPFFDDFVFKADEEIEAQFQWKQKGVEGYFHPQQLSESTLRFICLTAALLQPDPPAVLVFDEPELGLHPLAVHLLSELIHMASDDAQIIAATQSSVLVDYFEPDDIIVVERVDGASQFKRLCNKELEPWLEKYSLGELWRKNNIGGGPWGA